MQLNHNATMPEAMYHLGYEIQISEENLMAIIIKRTQRLRDWHTELHGTF